MIGGWKLAEMEPCDLPEQVATGFTQIFEGLDGASYVPVLYCGEQIVHGINHMIICKQTLVTATPAEHLVKIVINQPISYEPGQKWQLLGIDVIC